MAQHEYSNKQTLARFWEKVKEQGGGGGGGDDKVFIAVYNSTTAQEIIAYLDASNEPYAPMLIKRGSDYYTVTTASKQGADKVIIRSFATLSGDFYMFTYTVTNGVWASSSYGFQKRLESGTNIKTINGESLMGSGDMVISGGGGASLASAMDVTKAVGGISSGKTYAANTALETIFRDMLSPTLNPALTGPSAAVAGGGLPAMAKVGQEIPATTVTVALNRGSINPQYSASEPYRAGAATGYTLKMTGATVAFDESGSSPNFSLPAFTRHLKGQVTLTGTASYGEGPQPKDSSGANYSTPLPAGSVSANRNIEFLIPFYRGVSNDATIADLSGLTEDLTAKANKTYSFATDNQHCVFAYDLDYGSLSSIKDENGFETIDGWTKSVLGQCFVYVAQNKTTDPDAGYTFTF